MLASLSTCILNFLYPKLPNFALQVHREGADHILLHILRQAFEVLRPPNSYHVFMPFASRLVWHLQLQDFLFSAHAATAAWCLKLDDDVAYDASAGWFAPSLERAASVGGDLGGGSACESYCSCLFCVTNGEPHSVPIRSAESEGSAAAADSGDGEKSVNPAFNRQQSWNQEDMKRVMTER